ncbi:expressed unknown protein [Seminavis robusta]|uniref:Uncharacterized protein n=1 Tax=Seminavis robusta TaxID=568900 RepID=A0A9N8F3Q7_9STRA|nr:expressed unknown protein [Seminavis robusta]|eukprot:Sro3211_g345300.1 n/a (145) ;mRNA; r:1847-2281
MGISKELCWDEVNSEISLYWQVVLGSLLLTTLNAGLYGFFFRRAFEGAPGLAAQFFCVTGSIKVVLGLLVALLFSPSCPDNCALEICQAAHLPSPAYGLICSVIGALWLVKGYKFHQKAQTIENGESEGGKDTVFEQISTVEVV